MTPIERAAEAVCQARCDAGRPDPGKGLDEFIARAVLQALREPSEWMVGACRYGFESERRTNWTAMIDAALSE